MKVTRIFAALALVACFTGAAHAAQPGCVRLSWASCDPWKMDQAFSAAFQTLVVSAFGVGDDNVGTDMTIHIRPTLPDAWRFDNGGCQCPQPNACGWSANNSSFAKNCPALLGANSLTITNFSLAGPGEADLRLAVTYDVLVASASTRYTLWQVVFDHRFSNVGPTPPDKSTCGGAEQCEQFMVTSSQLLAATGAGENMPGCDVAGPSNVLPYATWMAASQCPVPTKNSTWGNIKGLYR